jgi:hypothetical protein
MSLAAAITAVLSDARGASPGVFVHEGTTYSVYRAYSTGDARGMMDAGYDPEEIDMVVLVRVDAIPSGATPRPGDASTLDGTTYTVKSPVTINPVFVMVPLRKTR